MFSEGCTCFRSLSWTLRWDPHSLGDSQFTYESFGLFFWMWGWFFFQFLSRRTMEWHCSWCFLWRVMMRNYLLCLQVFKNSLVRVPERVPIQVSGCGEANCNGKWTEPWGWWSAGRQSCKEYCAYAIVSIFIDLLCGRGQWLWSSYLLKKQPFDFHGFLLGWTLESPFVFPRPLKRGRWRSWGIGQWMRARGCLEKEQSCLAFFFLVILERLTVIFKFVKSRWIHIFRIRTWILSLVLWLPTLLPLERHLLFVKVRQCYLLLWWFAFFFCSGAKHEREGPTV